MWLRRSRAAHCLRHRLPWSACCEICTRAGAPTEPSLAAAVRCSASLARGGGSLLLGLWGAEHLYEPDVQRLNRAYMGNGGHRHQWGQLNWLDTPTMVRYAVGDCRAIATGISVISNLM